MPTGSLEVVVSEIARALEAVQSTFRKQHGELAMQIAESKARSVGHARTIKIMNDNEVQLHNDLTKCKERIQLLARKLADRGDLQRIDHAEGSLRQIEQRIQRCEQLQTSQMAQAEQSAARLSSEASSNSARFAAKATAVDRLTQRIGATEQTQKAAEYEATRLHAQLMSTTSQLQHCMDTARAQEAALRALEGRVQQLGDRHSTLARKTQAGHDSQQTKMAELFRHVEVLTSSLARERRDRGAQHLALQRHFEARLQEELHSAAQRHQAAAAATLKQVAAHSRVQQAEASRRMLLSTVRAPPSVTRSSGLFSSSRGSDSMRHMYTRPSQSYIGSVSVDEQGFVESNPYSPPQQRRRRASAPPPGAHSGGRDPRRYDAHELSELSASSPASPATQRMEAALGHLNDSVDGMLNAAAAASTAGRSVASTHESLQVPAHLMRQEHGGGVGVQGQHQGLFALAAQVQW